MTLHAALHEDRLATRRIRCPRGVVERALHAERHNELVVNLSQFGRRRAARDSRAQGIQQHANRVSVRHDEPARDIVRLAQESGSLVDLDRRDDLAARVHALRVFGHGYANRRRQTFGGRFRRSLRRLRGNQGRQGQVAAEEPAQAHMPVEYPAQAIRRHYARSSTTTAAAAVSVWVNDSHTRPTSSSW